MSLPCLEALSPLLNRAYLVQQLKVVLEFARRNLRQLDRNSSIWTDDIDPYVSVIDKVVVETALLVLIASRVAPESQELGEGTTELAGELAKVARSERNQVMLLRYPHTAASLGISHVILTCLGHRDAVFDVLVDRAFESGHVHAVERLPYRLADLRWLCGLRRPEAPPAFEDLVPHTMLVTGAHPIYMSVADVYALTHDLMYISDFGCRPLSSLVDVQRVSAMVDAALAWHIGTQNFDVLAELLLGAALLGGSWSPYARLAWCLLATTWDEFGFLPCPTFQGKEFSMLTGDDAAAYAFKHTYHTTYVAGILCAVLLRHPEHDATPALWTGPTPVLPDVLRRSEEAIAGAFEFCRAVPASLNWTFGEIAALDASIDAHAGPADGCEIIGANSRNGNSTALFLQRFCRADRRRGTQWTRIINDSVLSDDECALVLSDTLLIEAARQYDLAVFAATLAEASRLDTPASPTFLEAIEFLIRQQMPSGALGAPFVTGENLRSPAAAEITAGLAQSLAVAIARVAPKTEVETCSKNGGSVTQPGTSVHQIVEAT